MFLTSVSNTEWRKNMQYFLGIHFIGSFANIWNGKEKYLGWLNWRVKYGVYWWLACRGVWLLWMVQSNLVSCDKNPTPYYEMEYSSTDNIMTYFPYWCNYTRRCDDIHNCGVHQYARQVMNGRWKCHGPYMPFFVQKNINWWICF